MTEEEYEDLFFILQDGKEHCNDELALSILLKDDVVFCNSFDFMYHNSDKKAGHTVVLFVLCNDVFEWGCADSEHFSQKDIGPLIKMHLDNKQWGTVKWCILHRGSRPQPPVEKAMKEAGVWDDDLEQLRR